MKTKSRQEIVTIGDCTIDTFIRLHEATVECDLNHRNCMLCMSFADKIEYEDLKVVPAVGNSANIAVGAARQGQRARFMSAVGADEFGKQILRTLKSEKVDGKLVKVNRNLPTNNHFVLNFKGERTILVKHQPYEYFGINKIGKPKWIFFSSVGEHMLGFHKTLASYVKKNPQIKMGFNPGTFQIKFGRRKIAGIYRQTYVLFVNREEAQRVLEVKNPDIKYLMPRLHKLGPKIVCITDGPQGAYASDGKDIYYMPIYPDPAPPLERTGAGDSFSSGFMAALMDGEDFIGALTRAPINSMNVVQHVGAQEGLLTKKEIMALLKKAPKNYKPKLVSSI